MGANIADPQPLSTKNGCALKYIEQGLSAEQNIQQIIFASNAPLRYEFKKLFNSLFKNAAAYIELITLIAKKQDGIKRSELEASAKLSLGGGRLTDRINDLCSAGFIESRLAWQYNRGEYYKLIDEFSLFYLHWVTSKKAERFTQDHWLNQTNKSSYKAWAGYAFESICMKHIDQIIAALKIKGGSITSTWRFIPKKHLEDGAQIDLLIDRNDNAITICEIKHTANPFAIDKKYAKDLLRKVEVFRKKTRTDKQIFIAMISANGLKATMYSEELITAVVTLDDLFTGDEASQ
ncbi:MAG: hypothetical protein KAT71_00720 [Gammaproteobacteria bacterium]|nr:hypothetical protein [Gammaproteobacteria bacterium]